MTVSCAWCNQLAVCEVTVADAIIESEGGVKKLKHAAITAPACTAHREVTGRGTPPPAPATAQTGPGANHRVRLPRRRSVIA